MKRPSQEWVETGEPANRTLKVKHLFSALKKFYTMCGVERKCFVKTKLQFFYEFLSPLHFELRVYKMFAIMKVMEIWL